MVEGHYFLLIRSKGKVLIYRAIPATPPTQQPGIATTADFANKISEYDDVARLRRYRAPSVAGVTG